VLHIIEYLILELYVYSLVEANNTSACDKTLPKLTGEIEYDLPVGPTQNDKMINKNGLITEASLPREEE
jgi:hypothetical protein